MKNGSQRLFPRSLTRMFRQATEPDLPEWICRPTKPSSEKLSKMSTTSLPLSQVLIDGPTHWISTSFHSPGLQPARAVSSRLAGVKASSQMTPCWWPRRPSS